MQYSPWLWISRFLPMTAAEGYFRLPRATRFSFSVLVEVAVMRSALLFLVAAGLAMKAGGARPRTGLFFANSPLGFCLVLAF